MPGAPRPTSSTWATHMPVHAPARDAVRGPGRSRPAEAGPSVWARGGPDWKRRYRQRLETPVSATARGISGRSSRLLFPTTRSAGAQSAAQRALELDDTIASAHVSLGTIVWLRDFDWDAAGREFERSVDLDRDTGEAIIRLRDADGKLVALCLRPRQFGTLAYHGGGAAARGRERPPHSAPARPLGPLDHRRIPGVDPAPRARGDGAIAPPWNDGE